MGEKLTSGDKMKLFGFGVTLVAGLWTLWNADFSNGNIWMHIKFIYSLFITLAIVISAYYIVFKKEDKKKNVKRK